MNNKPGVLGKVESYFGSQRNNGGGSAPNPVPRDKPVSKIKLAKKYLFTGPIKRKVLITQGIKGILPNHYKVLENDIHKLINSLSPYIPTLINKKNNRSNENHGKRFIQDLFNLLIAIYKIKPPEGPTSPYWEGVIKGINEYNYKNVKNMALEKLANKIGLPITNKIVLNNIFLALRSPANSRTVESGKALGKDLAHILRHYKGSGQVLKSETRNKKYLEGIVLGLRPLGLEIIGEKNPRLANIARFATSKTVRAPGHTLRRVKLALEIPKALVCKYLFGTKLVYSAEKILKGVGSELVTWDSIPDNTKCIIKKLASDTGTKIIINSYKQRWYKVLGYMLNIYKLKTAAKSLKNINVALHPMGQIYKQGTAIAVATVPEAVVEYGSRYARIKRIEKGMKNTIEAGNARKRVFNSSSVLKPYKKWFNAVSARNKNKPNKRLTIEEAMSVIPRNARFKNLELLNNRQYLTKENKILLEKLTKRELTLKNFEKGKNTTEAGNARKRVFNSSSVLKPYKKWFNAVSARNKNKPNKRLTIEEAMSVIPRNSRFKNFLPTLSTNLNPEYYPNNSKFLTKENKILLLKLSEREKLSRFGALKKRVFG